MIETLRLVCDAGLLILIWMVQTIAYPSFSHFHTENLFTWHTKYVSKIAAIVIPLMFGQLICAAIQLYINQGFYELASIILIVSVWVITFAIFVGLHSNISNKKNVNQSVAELIHKNWIRTIIWSLVFLLTVGHEIMTS